MEILHLGRLITGVGSGMVCVASPLYIAEVSPKDRRGLLGSGVQLGVTVGILLVYTLGLFLTWLPLALVGALPALVGLALTSRIPETPRFYLMKGDKAGALRYGETTETNLLRAKLQLIHLKLKLL